MGDLGGRHARTPQDHDSRPDRALTVPGFRPDPSVPARRAVWFAALVLRARPPPLRQQRQEACHGRGGLTYLPHSRTNWSAMP